MQSKRMRTEYYRLMNHRARDEAAAETETAKRALTGRPRRVQQSDAANAAGRKREEDWAADVVARGVEYRVAHKEATHTYAISVNWLTTRVSGTSSYSGLKIDQQFFLRLNKVP